MTFRLRSCCAVLAVFGLLITSCGNDDPVATDSPCADANTTCLNVQLPPDSVSHLSVYNPGPNTTSHAITWNMDNVLFGYAPGQRVVITLNFLVPVEVRYAHNSEILTVAAGASALCYDRHAFPSPSVQSNGWVEADVALECMGDCATGASRVEYAAEYEALAQGDDLRQIKIEFTVPATYTSGTNSGTPILPGDLTPIKVQFVATVPGNTIGNPPAYPGDYPDDATTPKPEPTQ